MSDTSGSTILLANVYDGAGMRAVKTASDGTVYFLDDASGQPVVEETYTGSPTPTTTLSVVSAFGPAGLRSRYTVPTGSETQFFFDPQGTVVNRIASVDSGVAVKGEPMTDVSVWDGYGQERSDQWTNRTVDNQYTPSDPVGFEGQAGYYQDWELAKPSNPAQYVYLTTTPSLLTHRYYDASTGRFVNRDPIGYQGGTNLYAYCGGNPITGSDPSGEYDITVAGFEFTNANVSSGLRVGLAATGSALSYDLYDGGEYKNDPSFKTSHTLAVIGREAAVAAVGGAAGSKIASGLKAIPLGAKLVGSDAVLSRAAALVKPVSGYFDVVVHGTPTGFVVKQGGEWIAVSHRSLATYILKSGYTGGAIRLISCDTGALASGVAKDLANKLGVEVIAPSKTAWLHPNGIITIGGRFLNTGTWVRFIPGK